MPKLPRKFLLEEFRKFEKILTKYEDKLLNKKLFEKNIEQFLFEEFEDLSYLFKKIKVLIVFFLEDKRQKTNNEFENEIINNIKNQKEIDLKILRNKNLSHEFKDLIKHLNRIMSKKDNLRSFKNCEIVFKDLDRFNELLSKLLIKKLK